MVEVNTFSQIHFPLRRLDQAVLSQTASRLKA